MRMGRGRGGSKCAINIALNVFFLDRDAMFDIVCYILGVFRITLRLSDETAFTLNSLLSIAEHMRWRCHVEVA